MGGLFSGVISGLFWGAVLSGGTLAALSLWDRHGGDSEQHAKMGAEMGHDTDHQAKPDVEPTPVVAPEPAPEPAMPETNNTPIGDASSQEMGADMQGLTDAEIAAQVLGVDVGDVGNAAPTNVAEPAVLGADDSTMAAPAPLDQNPDDQSLSDKELAAQILELDPAGQETDAPAQENPAPSIETPAIQPQVPTPNIRTDRLPTIGSPDGEAGDVTAVNDNQPKLATQNKAGLATYAMDFENTNSLPLMSVILTDIPGQPLADDVLANLPFALSFAIDAARPDARQVAARYRRAGFEVVMLADLPEGADARDVEVTFGAYFRSMPEVVAVLDKGSNAATAQQVVDIIADAGLGLVTFGNGLHSAEMAAFNAGVPSTPIYRVLDDKGETANAIRNHLERAVFLTRQSGHVVMLGKTQPKTMHALLEWAAEINGKKVAIAPVSAVLLGK